jgi:hypothetical protein
MQPDQVKFITRDSLPVLESSACDGDLFSRPPFGKQFGLSTSKFQKSININMSDLLQKEQCDFLIDVYLKSYHPISPVIHVPSFLDDYKRIWPSNETADHSPPLCPAFFSLLTAILFAGSEAASSSNIALYFGDITKTELSDKLYRQTVKALKEASFATTPAIESLTAYLISQTVWYRGEFAAIFNLCSPANGSISKRKSLCRAGTLLLLTVNLIITIYNIFGLTI